MIERRHAIVAVKEADDQHAGGKRSLRNLAIMPSSPAGGRWIVEYQLKMPASEFAEASMPVIEPSRNSGPG